MSNLKSLYEDHSLSKPQYIGEMFEFHKILFEYAGMIGETDISRIEIRDGIVVFTSKKKGIKFACRTPDKRSAPFEIMNFGSYEEKMLSWICRLMVPGPIIFDIGANIGWYSINMSMEFPGSTIYSFEPVPDTFDSLSTNIGINNSRNVRIFKLGLSDSRGEDEFYCDPEFSVGASLRDITCTPGVSRIKCELDTIDDFVEANRVVGLDFIKCDVEGAEYLVLKGGLRSIARHRPMIMSELLRKWTAKFSYVPNQVIELLSCQGYRCFVADEDGLSRIESIDDTTVETNFFFLHTERHRGQMERFSKR